MSIQYAFELFVAWVSLILRVQTEQDSPVYRADDSNTRIILVLSYRDATR